MARPCAARRFVLLAPVGFALILFASSALAQNPPADTERPWLGVIFGPAPNSPNQLLVKDVTPDSPAAKGGLTSGDEVVKYDGQELEDIQVYRGWLRQLKVGQKVVFSVKRGDKALDLEVVVGPRPGEKTEAPVKPRAPAEALQAGIDWLLARQLENGSWPHADPSTLGGAQGLPSPPRTVLACLALQGLTQGPKCAAAYQKGLAYLLARRQPHGYVAEPEDALKLGNYSTAFMLRLLVQDDPVRHKEAIADFVAYFEREQLQESNKFFPFDWPHGGWNYFDEIRRSMLRADVTLSACVLHGISLAGVRGDTPVVKRALTFLYKCQNYDQPRDHNDGGFYFSPRNSKAGQYSGNQGEIVLDSYGTTTCDGFRSLLYAGLPVEDLRVQAAYRWIVKHFTVDVVPGFPEDHVIDWRLGLRYYYYYTLGLALAEYDRLSQANLDPTLAGWRAKLTGHLCTLQRADGSWKNQVNVMGEDDPLTATLLALNAMRTAGVAAGE